jgi:hypothetical protein
MPSSYWIIDFTSSIVLHDAALISIVLPVSVFTKIWKAPPPEDGSAKTFTETGRSSLAHVRSASFSSLLFE